MMIKISRVLDSVFSAYYEPPIDDEHFGPYASEEAWIRDYLHKSHWPAGDKHISGVPRVGGPELEDHPDFDRMWSEGWRPSRTRDALVHPSGRVLTVGMTTKFGPNYPPGGKRENWFEQGLGEGPVYSRGHGTLTDAISARGWEDKSNYDDDREGVERDLRWLEEDRNR